MPKFSIIYSMNRLLIVLGLIAVVLIAGCTQTPTGQAIVQPQTKYVCPDGSVVDNPNLCSNSTNISNTTNPELTNNDFACDANCTGSAGQCKEHQCVDGKCTIITLSNCCGNGVCEPNEMQGLYTNCSADCQTIVQEDNHASCAESGKISVLVIGMTPDKYTDDTESVLNEAIIGYPVNLTVIRDPKEDAMSVSPTNPIVMEYSITGFPSVIINCHLYFTGKRTVDNFKTIFSDLLETEDKT